MLPVTNCSNGSTEQPGSLEGIWYGTGQTRSEKLYLMRFTATDTTWLAEENRGIGWSATMKGSYTQSGGSVTAALEYADLNIDNIAVNWVSYDTLTPQQKEDEGIPLSTPVTMPISGGTISWGDLTMTHDKYADKLANTIAGGTVDGKLAEIATDGKKMWTMTVDTGSQMVNYLKGVYMMTGPASANIIITHANTTPPTTTWKYVDDSMTQTQKDTFLPSEGQILTINSITNSSLKMTIDGNVVTFTITPN